MSEVAIQSISVDPRGGIRVRPAGPSIYPYVYRDASSVRWDDVSGQLYMLEVPGFDAIAEFKQIVKAVRGEYGDHLMLSPKTEYIGLSDELIKALGKAG